MLVAATCFGNTTTMFINDISTWINETPTNRPMTDLYDADSGDYPTTDIRFTARPTVGGLFSLLALPASNNAPAATS